MQQERLYQLGQQLKREGDPRAAAKLLGNVLRVGGHEGVVFALAHVGENIRQTALDLLTIDSEERAILKVIAGLPEQLGEALQITALFEVNESQGDVDLPRPEMVMRSLRAQLSPAAAQEMLQWGPLSIAVYPTANAERYRKALDSEACRLDEEQLKARLSSFAIDHMNDGAELSGKISGYSFAVTQAARMNIPPWDDASLSFRQRMDDHFVPHFQGKEISRLDHRAFGVFVMRGLKQAKADGYYDLAPELRWGPTLLQGTGTNERGNNVVGYAHWEHGTGRSLLSLHQIGLDGVHVRAFLRPAFIGKVES